MSRIIVETCLSIPLRYLYNTGLIRAGYCGGALPKCGFHRLLNALNRHHIRSGKVEALSPTKQRYRRKNVSLRNLSGAQNGQVDIADWNRIMRKHQR